jgi:hypothetical protein
MHWSQIITSHKKDVSNFYIFYVAFFLKSSSFQFSFKDFQHVKINLEWKWQNRLASFDNLREDIGFGKYKDKAI